MPRFSIDEISKLVSSH